MTSPPKPANSPKDMKRAPIACTNCRLKKLRCRTDEGQKACTRCISDGCPCEYVPVNATIAPHNDSPIALQPPHQRLPMGDTPSGYYSTQPNNVQQPAPNPNSNPYIDPTLMGSQGNVVSNLVAAGNYPSGQSPFYPAPPPQGSPVHAAYSSYSQGHGHPGSNLPGHQWGQFAPTQTSPPMEQAQHGTYSWGANYYQHPTSASGDQQDYSYSQAKGDYSKR